MSFKADELQAQHVQFGIRFFTDKLENLFRIRPDRCATGRRRLLGEFDHVSRRVHRRSPDV